MHITVSQHAWSDDLRIATRDGLASLSVLPTRDGAVALKHVGGAAALLAEDDLLFSALRLVDRRTGVVSTFADADALVDAGWVLD